MPSFYNDVDGKVEAVLKNHLEAKKLLAGSNIASIDVLTGLSADAPGVDLIVCFADAGVIAAPNTGVWKVQATVSVYTQADDNTLADHRARVSEVRDAFVNTTIHTDLDADTTEDLGVIAVQEFSFSQRVEERYFVGDLSFVIVCRASET